MFSEILPEGQLANVAALNTQAMADFKTDASTQAYANYLHPESRALLKKISITNDHELALAITERLGHPDGSVCGLETLGTTVFDTHSGKGCCSDYSKSWLFYANYFGMTAREVSLFNHTTVEYLNRSTDRWSWLDPFNKIEILDANGQPLSLFEIRNASRFQTLKFRKTSSVSTTFDATSYAGYAPAQMGTILWRKGTNFLEVEAWDRVMQSWGFSKSMRQMVTLVAGVQPHWLMITTHADNYYYRSLRAFLWAAGGAWLMLNAIAVTWLTLALWSLKQQPCLPS
jgi:hypothetical protein